MKHESIVMARHEQTDLGVGCGQSIGHFSIVDNADILRSRSSSGTCNESRGASESSSAHIGQRY